MRRCRACIERFQCSSASRKFLNIGGRGDAVSPPRFQCSSASRKFLNVSFVLRVLEAQPVFQCSSASRKFLNYVCTLPPVTCPPFQCSSASRKFLNCSCAMSEWGAASVSVLFSEPKIPQWNWSGASTRSGGSGFSALQRAENSSMRVVTVTATAAY